MNGEIVCTRCRQGLGYHGDLKVLLPPTVRVEGGDLQKDNVEGEQV